MKPLCKLEHCGRLVLAAGLAACILATGVWAQASRPVPQTRPAEEPAGISVTRPGTFEIHVQGADLRGVLQLLSTQGKRNIIATKEVRGTVTADLYGVTFEQALKAVLASSGLDYLDEDGFIYVYTPQQKEAILKEKIRPVVRIFRLSYVTAVDAQTLVAPALSESGSVAVTPAASMGIAASKTETGGNSLASNDVLVVRDVPERIQVIAKLIEELDVKPDQVLIEATILSATLEEDNKLGVNFNVLAGLDFQDLGFEATMSGDPGYAANPLTEAAPSGINFRTDFSPVKGGMTFGVFGSDVAFFISALETINDVTVLANPKLLVVNKQRGEVLIGKRDGYLTTTVTETAEMQTVEFLETGTSLIVRPFIGKDDHIRMEIHPEDSDGGVTALGLPHEETTEVTSNVLVRDGHTIVIGGLLRERTQNNKNQIPLVGNIPYLGTLFRSHNDRTERDEVIVLITPHIVRQAVDEAIGEQLKDDAERFRIGQRNGLQWWACDRVAQSHLRWAKQHLRNGETEKALWDLDLALSMRPKMIEAIRLKERLTQKAYWADSARHSAVKYAIQRMIMHELGRPVEGIIPPDKPRNAEGIDPAVKKALGIEPRLEPPLPGAVERKAAPAGPKPKPPAKKAQNP